MRTYYNHNGYGISKDDITKELYHNICEELTVSPIMVDLGFKQKPPKWKMYRESETKLYVPRYYGLSRYGIPQKQTIQDGVDIDLKFNGELRNKQKEPVEEYIKAAHDPLRRGGLLNLGCAFGKTVLTLYIIAELRKKTLVIVHKDFLLKQWRERIEQFLPLARVGLIKAQTIDVDNKDIVMCSLQSLAMKEYDKAVFEEFGCVVVDEVHHIGSKVFSRALNKINFKYALGLSATMNRQDGLTKVFKWYLGDIVYKENNKMKEEVNVEIHYYDNDDMMYREEFKIFTGRPNTAKMINSICNFKNRNEYIVNIIQKIKHEERERNIMILSDRREHLQIINKMIKNLRHPYIRQVGYYIGGLKETTLKETEEKADVILATYSMASEGLDIPKLDTVMLISPKTSIEQSIGRILRKRPDERQYIPLIVDIQDGFSVFVNQGKKREKHYVKCHYNIEYIGNEEDDEENIEMDEMDGCMIK